MVEMVLPFSRENNADTHEGTASRCELYEMLPEDMRAVCDEHVHMLEYLHMVPISQVGVPRYYTELSRKMDDLKEPNLIYPIGEGIFVHILVDFKESRNHYILIEPTLTSWPRPSKKSASTSPIDCRRSMSMVTSRASLSATSTR